MVKEANMRLIGSSAFQATHTNSILDLQRNPHKFFKIPWIPSSSCHGRTSHPVVVAITFGFSLNEVYSRFSQWPFFLHHYCLLPLAMVIIHIRCRLRLYPQWPTSSRVSQLLLPTLFQINSQTSCAFFV